MPRRNGKASGSADNPSKPLEGLSVCDSERDEFLAALEQIDPAAALVETEEPSVRRAEPRRLKKLERGEIKPAETLDLHGLTREEALHRCGAFLGHAARQGWTAVVIVTGKGLHSPTGPVLRQAIEQLLTDSPQLVLEWTRAPRRYGGAGALVVFLRQAGG